MDESKESTEILQLGEIRIIFGEISITKSENENEYIWLAKTYIVYSVKGDRKSRVRE